MYANIFLTLIPPEHIAHAWILKLWKHSRTVCLMGLDRFIWKVTNILTWVFVILEMWPTWNIGHAAIEVLSFQCAKFRFDQVDLLWVISRQRFHIQTMMLLRRSLCIAVTSRKIYPDSKVHGTNMGPIWGRSAPDGPMLAPWTLLSGYVLSNHQHKKNTPELLLLTLKVDSPYKGLVM